MSFQKKVDFHLSKDHCFICGEIASTVEHIFPKWLQRKFNLWNEKLSLPNNTSITYKQLTVPACIRCNRDVFGKIEKKIESGKATDKEIWRWLNKIHFGLTFKDSFLEWDRKNPKHKIGEVFKPYDPLKQSRSFLHCASGDFQCTPDPFGSIFKFEFEKEEDYNFIHIPNSKSIYICLGRTVYIGFVIDGQTLINERAIKDDYYL